MVEYLHCRRRGRARRGARVLSHTTLFVAFLLASNSLADFDPAAFPLEAPDTASPRGTIGSFMSATARGNAMLRASADAREVLWTFRWAERCLDLREVSPDQKTAVAAEAGLMLYEVLVRVGLPNAAAIPGPGEVAEQAVDSWRVPRTEITINRMTEGPRAGEFLISAETVRNARLFYFRVSFTYRLFHPGSGARWRSNRRGRSAGWRMAFSGSPPVSRVQRCSTGRHGGQSRVPATRFHDGQFGCVRYLRHHVPPPSLSA